MAPEFAFTAGFAFGRVLFDHLGTDSYSEWSVYGNCINAAKRLQSMPRPEEEGCIEKPQYRVALGALESDYPDFDRALRYGLEMAFPAAGLNLHAARIGLEHFRGVGPLWFLSASV